MTKTTASPFTRWRRKPVEVDAAPWDGSVSGATAIIDWTLANGGTIRYHDALPGHGEPAALSINTLEGTMTALAGYCVVRGVAGEFHAVRGDIFHATYEPVTETTGKTPGQVLHDSLRESATARFGLLVGDFATWEQVPEWQQGRLEKAARDLLASYASAALDMAVDALQHVRLSADDRLAALAREALAKVDKLTGGSAAVPRGGDYKAYADSLFAPVKNEVARLRAQLADAGSVSVDIGSPEDGDYDNCEPTL